MNEEIRIDKLFVNDGEFANNKDIEVVNATNVVGVLSFGAFKDCTNLKEIFFGADISRIGHGAFKGCTSLTDVWFAVIDKNKLIEIAEDAFDNCPNQITFHIFATARQHKILNDYARRHNFKVAGTI